MLSSTIPIPKAPTMNNQQVPRAKTLTIFLFIFLFHANLNVIATSNDSIYTPTDQILVSCGSSGGTDAYGRNWTGDLKPSGFLLSEPPTNKSTAASATYQGSTDGIPYTNARLSRSTFTYSFALAPGKKFLRLYFHPDVYQFFSKSGDYINVKAGNHVLLINFSASSYSADWSYPSFSLEYYVSVHIGERLNVSFYSSDYEGSYVFVNGIEIVSMPDELYYSPHPPLIGRDKEYYNSIGNDTAMEVMCRLNVGGNQISKMDDTGMFRTWDTDDNYMFPLYGVVPLDPNVTLNFTRIPRYVAPEDLYKSARTMGLNRLANDMTNMTWGVPVESGFDHLVRLHFCEFDVRVTEVNYRRIVIYIDNQTAEAGFDVMEASGGKNIPIYRDYVVRSAKGSGSRYYTIFIKLYPHPESVFADVILNGLEVFKLSHPDGNITSSINVDIPAHPAPAPTPPAAVPSVQPADNKSINKATLYGLIGGGGLFCLLMMFLVCLIHVWTLKKRKNHEDRTDPESSICSWFLKPSYSKPSREGSSSSLKRKKLVRDEGKTKHDSLSSSGSTCRCFSLSEIKAATNNFNQELIIGLGGFGNVYKGFVDKGATAVAIKRLQQGSDQGANEFKMEIEMLSQLRYLHLVSLIGYCDKKKEMILVYDYMSRGSLRDHLYNTVSPPLPWERRLRICIGTARGLQYLHSGVKRMIIHRDVKTTNILLDEKWVANVSDFGLSKVGPSSSSVTHISTMVKGSFGYLDPEYYYLQRLTQKSDVYSFGVVLCEVLCAKPAIIRSEVDNPVSLAIWFRTSYQRGTLDEIIDPYLIGKIAPECLNKYAELAFHCIAEIGVNRPQMGDVVWGLELALRLQDAATKERVVEMEARDGSSSGEDEESEAELELESEVEAETKL